MIYDKDLDLMAKKDTLELIIAGKKRIKFGDKMIADFEKHVKSGEFEKNLLNELNNDELLG
jgi:hypothetical protein